MEKSIWLEFNFSRMCLLLLFSYLTQFVLCVCLCYWFCLMVACVDFVSFLMMHALDRFCSRSSIVRMTIGKVGCYHGRCRVSVGKYLSLDFVSWECALVLLMLPGCCVLVLLHANLFCAVLLRVCFVLVCCVF